MLLCTCPPGAHVKHQNDSIPDLPTFFFRLKKELSLYFFSRSFFQSLTLLHLHPRSFSHVLRTRPHISRYMQPDTFWFCCQLYPPDLASRCHVQFGQATRHLPSVRILFPTINLSLFKF